MSPYADPPWTPERLACAVFFARAPPTASQEELEALFGAYGRLLEVQLFRAFAKCKVSRVSAGCPAAGACGSGWGSFGGARASAQPWALYVGDGLIRQPLVPGWMPHAVNPCRLTTKPAVVVQAACAPLHASLHTYV